MLWGFSLPLEVRRGSHLQLVWPKFVWRRAVLPANQVLWWWEVWGEIWSRQDDIFWVSPPSQGNTGRFICGDWPAVCVTLTCVMVFCAIPPREGSELVWMYELRNRSLVSSTLRFSKHYLNLDCQDFKYFLVFLFKWDASGPSVFPPHLCRINATTPCIARDREIGAISVVYLGTLEVGLIQFNLGDKILWVHLGLLRNQVKCLHKYSVCEALGVWLNGQSTVVKVCRWWLQICVSDLLL